jgi:inner membrane protein
VPLPIAHAFVGAGVVVASRSRITIHDWKALSLAASIAVLPDFDFFLTWFGSFDETWHRGFSHSIAFAIIIGVGVAVLARKSFLRDVVVYGGAILSHGLCDVLTTKHQGGVELFWPFWAERMRFGFFEYPLTVVPHPPQETWAFITLSIIKASLKELFIFLPAFTLLLAYKRARSARRDGKLQASRSTAE